MTIYTLQCVPGKAHQAFILFTLVVTRHLCLDPGKVLVDTLLTFKINKSACASQLLCSPCKSFCALSFMLLLVPYYSVYIIIMQWLVGWLVWRSRQKASAKKCSVAPWCV